MEIPTMTDAPSPKFLADENVGKLGRWLRILGYDVAYQSPALDAQLALKALRENRVILTRDREFVERRMVEQTPAAYQSRSDRTTQAGPPNIWPKTRSKFLLYTMSRLQYRY